MNAGMVAAGQREPVKYDLIRMHILIPGNRSDPKRHRPEKHRKIKEKPPGPKSKKKKATHYRIYELS